MKKEEFDKMSARDRSRHLAREIDSNRVKEGGNVPLMIDQLRDALLAFGGPMTTRELARACGYHRVGSLTAWAGKNQARLEEYGIRRYQHPADSRSRVWALDSHMEAVSDEIESDKVKPERFRFKGRSITEDTELANNVAKNPDPPAEDSPIASVFGAIRRD